MRFIQYNIGFCVTERYEALKQACHELGWSKNYIKYCRMNEDLYKKLKNVKLARLNKQQLQAQLLA